MSELKQLAEKYDEYNSRKKEYDSKRKQIRDTMMQLMDMNDIDKFEGDNVKVRKITNQNKKVNEEKLLEVIKRHDLNAIKESPDLEKLENLLESGELDGTIIQEISDCINISEYSYVKVNRKDG